MKWTVRFGEPDKKGRGIVRVSIDGKAVVAFQVEYDPARLEDERYVLGAQAGFARTGIGLAESHVCYRPFKHEE